MNKLRDYFIGDFLRRTDDVFEKARIIMLFRFSLAFLIIFMLPLTTDIVLGYYKGAILHIMDTVMIIFFIFRLRNVRDLDNQINFFFAISYVSSILAFMIFNPLTADKIGVTWSFSFLTLSALMQRGFARIICTCVFAWLPLAYVYINIQWNGALTVPFLVQPGAQEPPLFLILIPVSLSIFAIWSHTNTIQKAKETIVMQKEIIEEKNKDITDSIRYAKRIQESLLPTEKYIEKTLSRLKKK